MPFLANRRSLYYRSPSLYGTVAGGGGSPGELYLNPATVDLSNGNLTATANADAAGGGPLNGANSRSFTGHSSGKFCFRATYGTLGQSGAQGSGIVNDSEPNTNYVGATNNSIGFEINYFGTSNFYQNDAHVGSGFPSAGFSGGDILFAVDLDGKFMCVSGDGGGSWYGTTGSANADYTTGANCLDLSAIAFPWHAALDTYSNGKTLTIILTSVSGKPSGYSDWG